MTIVVEQEKVPVWRTGYPRGRPRDGEVRPPSKNAIKMQKYRKKYAEKHREYNRIAQMRWVTTNAERNKQNRRDRRARLKQNKYFETLAWLSEFEKVMDA